PHRADLRVRVAEWHRAARRGAGAHADRSLSVVGAAGRGAPQARRQLSGPPGPSCAAPRGGAGRPVLLSSANSRSVPSAPNLATTPGGSDERPLFGDPLRPTRSPIVPEAH